MYLRVFPELAVNRRRAGAGALLRARAADDPLDEARDSLADRGEEAEAFWYRSLVAEFTGGACRLRRELEGVERKTPLANIRGKKFQLADRA